MQPLTRTKRLHNLTLFEKEQKLKTLTEKVVNKLFTPLQTRYPCRTLKKSHIKLIKRKEHSIDPQELPCAQPQSFSDIQVPGYTMTVCYNNETFTADVPKKGNWVRLHDFFDDTSITKSTLQKLHIILLKTEKIKPTQEFITDTVSHIRVCSKDLTEPQSIYFNGKVTAAIKIILKISTSKEIFIISQTQMKARHISSRNSLINGGKVFNLQG